VSIYKCTVFAVAMLVSIAPVHAATGDEVKATFAEFIDAQNHRKLATVKDILLDSPHTLWVAHGKPVWGQQAILRGFQKNYRGTWKIEPDTGGCNVTELSADVAQLVVPAMITFAPGGQRATPSPFLLTQIYIRTASGWKLSSILTVPAA
jgi:hypothetical protein